MNRWMLIAGLLAVALTGCASAGNPKINRDPFYESFFEKTSLIMTKEEIEIYKHLPDDQERRDFIVEFWKSRDPYPETPGNEFKIEFEQRIAYANRWFRENQAAGRGWNTERGRILLLLGQPEKREWQDDIGPQQAMQMGLSSDVRGVEVWTYYDLQ